MKVIIAGSRDCNDYDLLCSVIEKSGIEITEVVSGGARGVDTMGEKWAEENNIPVIRFPAEWDKHGKSAGFIRNSEMAKFADALIAIQINNSRGTAHMVEQMRKRNKEYVLYGE